MSAQWKYELCFVLYKKKHDYYVKNTNDVLISLFAEEKIRKIILTISCVFFNVISDEAKEHKHSLSSPFWKQEVLFTNWNQKKRIQGNNCWLIAWIRLFSRQVVKPIKYISIIDGG